MCHFVRKSKGMIKSERTLKEVKQLDKFYTQQFCDRCHGSLKDGRTMSMFNEQCICMKCKEAETRREDYQKAVDADREEIKKRNWNFKGIGF